MLFVFQAEDGIRDYKVTGVQTCALPISLDDQRLVDAHEQSAKIAFKELETFAATRVRKHGSQRDRNTGNLAAAGFTRSEERRVGKGCRSESQRWYWR